MYMKPSELAGLLGVSTRTITRLCAAGKIPAVKVGSQWRIPRKEAEWQLGKR